MDKKEILKLVALLGWFFASMGSIVWSVQFLHDGAILALCLGQFVFSWGLIFAISRHKLFSFFTLAPLPGIIIIAIGIILKLGIKPAIDALNAIFPFAAVSVFPISGSFFVYKGLHHLLKLAIHCTYPVTATFIHWIPLPTFNSRDAERCIPVYEVTYNGQKYTLEGPPSIQLNKTRGNSYEFKIDPYNITYYNDGSHIPFDLKWIIFGSLFILMGSFILYQMVIALP